MAWLDRLKRGLEEVVGQVGSAQAEVLAQQYYRAGRAAGEGGFRERSAAQAVADLEEAVKADSNFLPDAKRWLAKACEACGNLDRSRRCYLEAIELMERDDTGRLAAWVAAEYDLDPDDYVSELCDDLAVQLARQGRHDEAIYHARRAVETNRDNMNAYHTLISSLQATGDADEVRRWLFRARERDALGLVEQWVVDLGIDEEVARSSAGTGPLSQFEGIELPGLEVEDDDG